MRAEVFRALDGYRDLALMEDLDFTQRLKRRGRSVLITTPLVTSGRRFTARGPWRTFAFIVWLLALWTLRLDTQRYAERWRNGSGNIPEDVRNDDGTHEINGSGNVLGQATHDPTRPSGARYK